MVFRPCVFFRTFSKLFFYSGCFFRKAYMQMCVFFWMFFLSIDLNCSFGVRLLVFCHNFQKSIFFWWYFWRAFYWCFLCVFFCCLSGCFSWCFLVVFLFLGVFTSIFKICILFRVFFCNISENGYFLRMCFFFHQSQKLLFVVWFLRYFFYSYFLSFSRYFLLLVFSMFLCVVFCL